jgi:hypothetical protein
MLQQSFSAGYQLLKPKERFKSEGRIDTLCSEKVWHTFSPATFCRLSEAAGDVVFCSLIFWVGEDLVAGPEFDEVA